MFSENNPSGGRKATRPDTLLQGVKLLCDLARLFSPQDMDPFQKLEVAAECEDLQ